MVRMERLSGYAFEDAQIAQPGRCLGKSQLSRIAPTEGDNLRPLAPRGLQPCGTYTGYKGSSLGSDLIDRAHWDGE